MTTQPRNITIVLDLNAMPGAITCSARAVLTQKRVLELLIDNGWEADRIEELLRELGRNCAAGALSAGEEIE